MHSFLADQPARFYCEADFTAGLVLNINFFDRSRQAIPFHLSVRRDEGLIVVNRRVRQGWRREIPFAATFEHRAVPVEIVFSRRRVTVRVDGRRLGSFDAFPRPDMNGRLGLRRGFAGLTDIAWVEIDGATVPGSMVLDSPSGEAALLRRGVTLSDAFEVQFATVPAASDLDEMSLHVQGLSQPIPAVSRRLRHADPRTGRPAIAVTAVVPGRAWGDARARLEMSVIDSRGQTLGQIAITRQDLARRIGALCLAGALEKDDRVALQAIEHSRHARIHSLLTPTQRAALHAAAERFGLQGFLGDTSETAALLPAPSENGETRHWRSVDALLARFFDERRSAPNEDPVACAERLFDASDLPPAFQVELALALCDWFCVNEKIADLAAMLRKRGLSVPGATGSDEVWRHAALLPFLFEAGEFQAVALALRRLVERPESWVSSAAVGWIAGRVGAMAENRSGARPTQAERAAIIDGLIAFVDARARPYWNAVANHHLIAGLVTILASLDTLEVEQRSRFAWMLARGMGLVPAFWARVAAQGIACTGLLAEAQTRFKSLVGTIETFDAMRPRRAALLDSLATFQGLGNVDYPRFFWDLAGPATRTVEPAGAINLRFGLEKRINPTEAALRLAGHPGVDRAALQRAPRLAELLRAGIVAGYDRVPEGPFDALQTRIHREGRRVLADPGGVSVDRLRHGLSVLSSDRAGGIGFGIAISLVTALLNAGAESQAREIVAMIERNSRQERCHAASPLMAYQALQASHPSSALTKRIRDALGLASVLLPPEPKRDLTKDLSAAADPMVNTLVCLYSCQKNLDTRVEVIRRGWMAGLAQTGLSYLVFVGGGDGRREGDVVYLDAPDDYEGLPQKSLAMAKWVLDNTSFSYLHKIDDDCFLVPDEFFGALTPQKFDYYGRPLTRRRGEMDRTWHMAKSSSDRGRFELDKSPEPSTYADGSTSYVLSRRAMAELDRASATPEGRDLIHLSFMEDKLLGDLLRLRGIKVSGESFRCSILRRARPGGVAVPQWENGFLPFAGSGIKLAHLDGVDTQDRVLAESRAPLPASFKVWPTFEAAHFGWCRNILDLVSSREKLRRVNAAPVTVVACLRNESFLIERFLSHYRALGVQGFLIADNGSDDGSFEILADQPDVALFSVDTDYGRSAYGVAWQQALLANFRVNRWSVIADADEFLISDLGQGGSLTGLADELDAEGADAARVFMLDMYPQGPLAGADFKTAGPFEQAPFVDRQPFLPVPGAHGPFGDSPVWTSALRHRLIPGSRPELFVAQKYALLKYRPWMRLSAGLHFVSDLRLSRRELFFAHFKYNAAFHEKAQAEVARRQHFNNAEEYRKYLALVAEGRDVVFDEAVSVRWDACDFVKERMARL